MKERRVTSQQVTKAGGILPLVGQLVETLRKGSMGGYVLDLTAPPRRGSA